MQGCNFALKNRGIYFYIRMHWHTFRHYENFFYKIFKLITERLWLRLPNYAKKNVFLSLLFNQQLAILFTKQLDGVMETSAWHSEEIWETGTETGISQLPRPSALRRNSNYRAGVEHWWRTHETVRICLWDIYTSVVLHLRLNDFLQKLPGHDATTQNTVIAFWGFNRMISISNAICVLCFMHWAATCRELITVTASFIFLWDHLVTAMWDW